MLYHLLLWLYTAEPNISILQSLWCCRGWRTDIQSSGLSNLVKPHQPTLCEQLKDPQWRIHMGKNYQKLTGKCNKYKSTCIFDSIFIASSQRHIQWGLQAIWGQDGEKRKRMSTEHGSFSICWMQFIDSCNQTGIICIIRNMQYRKSTILCWFI